MEFYFALNNITLFFIAISFVVLTAFYTLLLWYINKKKRGSLSCVYWGAFLSLACTSAFIIHWFMRIEYWGNIGYGLGVFVSPVVIPVAAGSFFLLGWSLNKMFFSILAFTLRKKTYSMKAVVMAILALAVCSIAIYGYVKHLIPADYGLTAVPEMNFTDNIFMVRTSGGYWVGAYEVTQSQFEKVMGYNPANAPVLKAVKRKYEYKGPDIPAVYLSVKEALAFCEKLTDLERESKTLPEGYVYTLPTARQWREFVADAREKTSVFPIHGSTAYPGLREVGGSSRNRLGLFDVRGNVNEYCIESHNKTNTQRYAIRGGSFKNLDKYTRRLDYCSSWNPIDKESRGIDIGFRVVLVKELE